MRRYWKLGSLTLFIVVSLTGFFLQSSAASSNYPDFVIESEKDPASIENKMIVEGVYSEDDSQRHGYMTTTNKGTNYLLLDNMQLQNGFMTPEMNELQKRYKNFMRGKDECLACYDETKEELIYTNVYFQANELNYYFDVDVLSKETGDRKTFELDLPNEKDQVHLNVFPEVHKVYLANGELKVIASLLIDDAETDISTEEIHVFSIDINQESIIDDERVMTIEENEDDEDVSIETELVNEENQQEASHLVIRRMIEKDDDEGNFETELYAYHLDSHESEELPLSEKLGTENQLIPLQVSGDHLFLYEISHQEITFYDYHLSKQKLEGECQMRLPEEMTDDVFVKLQDNYLLVANGQNVHPLHTPLLVFDLKTEESLYEGKIDTDQTIVNNYNFWIDDIKIQ